MYRAGYAFDDITRELGDARVLRVLFAELGLTGPESTLKGRRQSTGDLLQLLLDLPFPHTETGTVAEAIEFYALVLLTLPEIRKH